MNSVASETFGDRLEQVMNEKNVNQAGLAKMTGLSQVAVSHWLKGTTPTKKNVQRIAVNLDLNEDWLLHGRGQKELPVEARTSRDTARAVRKEAVTRLLGNLRDIARTISVRDPHVGTERVFPFDMATDDQWALMTTQIEAGYHMVTLGEPSNRTAPPKTASRIVHMPRGHQLRPLLGSIAAGLPQDAIQQADDYVILPLVLAAQTTFALKARGDSMIDKGIFDGDIVLMDHRREARNGNVVAALCDQETCLKTFVTTGREQPYLRSENSSFPPKIFPLEELTIQGVMIGKL